MITGIRVDRNVPFVDKDRARAKGARWDGGRRTWYAAPGTDLEPLASWLPSELEAPCPVVDGAETPALKGVSLAAFLARVRAAVSRALPDAEWVRAEINSLSEKNGNLYPELVEQNDRGVVLAKARGFIWREHAAAITAKFEEAIGGPLKPGIKVLLRARAEFDMHFGFSLNVVDVDPAYTLGDLAAKLRQIRTVLQRERLYDLNRALLTPVEFVRVAVISPETSAGLGDFRAEVDRLQNAGLCHFRFVTATFQGPDAPWELQAAVQVIVKEHERRPYDALVIIRGGGAAVDLSWLNDLELARTLCNAPLPCFTGIGHERDSTILDEVAHRKFDSPSKVALHISRTITDKAMAAVTHIERIRDLTARALAARHLMIDAGRDRVAGLAERALERSQRAVAQAADTVLTGSRNVIREAAQDVEHTAATVEAGTLALLQVTAQDLEHTRDRVTAGADGRCCDAAVAMQRAVDRLGHWAQMALATRASEVGELGRVVLTGTASRLAGARGGLEVLRDRVTREAGHQTTQAAASLDHQAEAVRSGTASALRTARMAVEGQGGRVLGFGPETTLRRGFALVRDAEGKPVTSRAAAAEHHELHVQFQDGTLRVENRDDTGRTADG